MPKKPDLPRIASATFEYNGKEKEFNAFMENLIRTYLDSDSVPNIEGETSVQKVEVSESGEKKLDK